MSKSLHVVLLALHATPVFARAQFRDWYAEYGFIFDQIIKQNCSSQFDFYETGRTNNTYWMDSARWLGSGHEVIEQLAVPLVNCMLNACPEFIKSDMASANVVLGLAPSILSVLGSTVEETSLLAVVGNRPFLALSLAAGSPAVIPLRPLEDRDPLEALKARGDDLPPNLYPYHIEAIISIIEYAFVIASIANVAELSLELGFKTTLSFAPGYPYFIIAWSFFGPVAHTWAALGLNARARRVDAILRVRREKEEPPFNETEDEAELNALFTSYQAALEEHHAILDSELTTVLEKCLPHLKNATTVRLQCYPIEFLLNAKHHSFHCFGLRELKSKFNTDDMIGNMAFADFQQKMLSTPLGLAFSQIVKAVIKSTHKVRALHTCGNIACGMKLGSIRLSESQYQSLLPLLTDLMTLHMCICIKDNESETFDEDAFKHLLSILVTVAPKLKVLTFAQWSPLEELSPLYFQDLSQNIRFCQLEELHLHSIELTLGNFKRFLQTAAPTLRRLSMKKVSLTDAIIGTRDPGPLTEDRSSWGPSLSHEVINKIQELWKRSFELLAQSPKLQFVQLSSLGYRGREIILQDDLYMERGQPDARPNSNARRPIYWPAFGSDPTRGQSSWIDFFFDAERANVLLKRWLMQLRMEMCNPGIATTQLPGTRGLTFNQDGVDKYLLYQLAR
ncbi:hypothetical protein N7454_010094 [Penicillium verhagenii]|nr:hypothetical protein N7454_010094 [Penicillium verhagenii]